MTMLAAIDLGIVAELLLPLIAEQIPALEVTGAELAFFVLFITRAHARNAALDLGSIAEGVHQLGHGHGFVAGCVFWIRHIPGSYCRTYHDPASLMYRRSGRT